MGLIDSIASGFNDVVNGVTGAVVGVGETAYNALTGVGDAVIRSAQGAVYTVQEFWDYFASVVGAWFQDNFVKPFTAIVSALPDVVVGGALALARAVASSAVSGISAVFS